MQPITWLMLICAVGGALSWTADRYQDEILQWHNDYRRVEGGTRMWRMEWDQNLASGVDKWMQKCQFSYDNDDYGENYAFYYGSDDMDNMQQAFRDWYNEREFYSYNNNNCGYSCRYTQMVWYNSRRVGCAINRCANMNAFGQQFKNTWFFGCWYDPKGNYDNEYPYYPGEPCSECMKDGYSCDNGLCYESNMEQMEVELNNVAEPVMENMANVNNWQGGNNGNFWQGFNGNNWQNGNGNNWQGWNNGNFWRGWNNENNDQEGNNGNNWQGWYNGNNWHLRNNENNWQGWNNGNNWQGWNNRNNWQGWNNGNNWQGWNNENNEQNENFPSMEMGTGNNWPGWNNGNNWPNWNGNNWQNWNNGNNVNNGDNMQGWSNENNWQAWNNNGGCKDWFGTCMTFYNNGDCQNFPNFMGRYCSRSCGWCGGEEQWNEWQQQWNNNNDETTTVENTENNSEESDRK